jgi:hypothetical protein
MYCEPSITCPAATRPKTGTALPVRGNTGSGRRVPKFIDHPSFRSPGAAREYGVASTPPDDPLYLQEHMPDVVTRDLSRRMHYAAFRWQQAVTSGKAGRWRRRYYALRDRIVLGNRKLIFRAIRRPGQDNRHIDDLIGECDIVLLQAVGTFNPWMGIRFSTYAFTCLLRALAHLRRRMASVRFVRLRLSGEADDRALARFSPDELLGVGDPWRPLLRYFCKEDALLSEREKAVLVRRYRLAGQAAKATLEDVGRELNLSKERVRQIQMDAVRKLRRALLGVSELAGAMDTAR